MLACRLLGHRPHFTSDGAAMRWSCERGCGAGGEKRYTCAADAARYAAAFDRRDVRTLGRRAPYFGLFPLRIWQWLRARRRQRMEAEARRGEVHAPGDQNAGQSERPG